MDIWTEVMTVKSYQGITAHYLEGKYQRFIGLSFNWYTGGDFFFDIGRTNFF